MILFLSRLIPVIQKLKFLVVTFFFLWGFKFQGLILICGNGLESEIHWLNRRGAACKCSKAVVPTCTQLKSVGSCTWLTGMARWWGLAQHLLPSLYLMVHPSVYCQSHCQKITNLLEKHENVFVFLIPGFSMLFITGIYLFVCWRKMWLLKGYHIPVPRPILSKPFLK